jgi:hypothetical protein
MKFGSALAILALASLTPSVPASAAKDDKLSRCNGRQKRPANPYGTILPTLPDRSAPAAAVSPRGMGVPRGTPSLQSTPAPSASPTTNLFPPASATPAPQGPDTSAVGKVPAIGAIGSGAGPTAALPTSYASC